MEMNANQNLKLNGSVKAIFEMLYDILAMFEASRCYNYIPGTQDEDGAEEYFEGLIENTRKRLAAEFPDKHSEERQKLELIIGETESCVKSCEVPGVVDRWREINPKINYFDCVFELIEEVGMETAEELNSMDMLAFFPSEKDFEARKEYLGRIERANDAGVYQEELLKTLENVFESDFCGEND